MPFYLPILKTAWRTAIRERRLWWYALFAGLLIGSGIGTTAIQIMDVDPTRGTIAAIVSQNTQPINRPALLWAQARATGTGATIALGAYGLFLLSLFGLILWLAIIGANALIIAAERTAQTADIPTDLRQRAQRPFWSTFGIHVIAKAATTVLVTVWGMTFALTAFAPTRSVTLAGIISFGIIAFLIAIFHLITPYAIADAVIDRQRTWPALRDAFALFRERWLITIEMSVLLTIANAIGIFAWLVGSFLLALPFLFLGNIGLAQGSVALSTGAIVAGLIVLILYLTIIAAVFTTFLTTAWTLLYLRLTGEGEEPEPWLRRLGRRT